MRLVDTHATGGAPSRGDQQEELSVIDTDTTYELAKESAETRLAAAERALEMERAAHRSTAKQRDEAQALLREVRAELRTLEPQIPLFLRGEIIRLQARIETEVPDRGG